MYVFILILTLWTPVFIQTLFATDPVKPLFDLIADKDEKSLNKETTHSFTASVTFISDYRTRGISQTMRRPAIQRELKYLHSSGYYTKVWGSNVDGTSRFFNNTSLELDFYLGKTHQLGKTSFSYDAGFVAYYYPGAEARVPKRVTYNTMECYLTLIYKKFTFRLYQTLTDYFAVNSDSPAFNWKYIAFVEPNGHSYGSSYIEANYEWSLLTKCIIGFHVGYQRVKNYPQLNVIDWQVSLNYPFSWINVSLFYIATNANSDFFNVPDSSFKPRKRHLGAPSLF